MRETASIGNPIDLRGLRTFVVQDQAARVGSTPIPGRRDCIPTLRVRRERSGRYSRCCASCSFPLKPAPTLNQSGDTVSQRRSLASEDQNTDPATLEP